MFRPLWALAAIAVTAAPAAAATYSASIAAPAPAAKIAARDLVWSCAQTSCVGISQTSRPVVICQALAKQTGKIQSFKVDGRELAASDLDRCNASAKRGSDRALATAR